MVRRVRGKNNKIYYYALAANTIGGRARCTRKDDRYDADAAPRNPIVM